jgi:hypothetical protein
MAISYDNNTACDPVHGDLLISYMDSTDSSSCNLILYNTVDNTDSNADKFIGISQNSALDGEDVYVVSNGGVDNHQSGLTSGTEYWIDGDGSLSETSTGYSKIGFALNSNVISLYGLDISMFIP